MNDHATQLRGNGVAELRESLLAICRTSRWPMLEPLPVTRFLGESFGISNVSAFRVLNAFSKSGQLWRAPNGRYFLPGAKRLLDKPLPIACLLRRLERWSEVGREIMLGVDKGCGDLERAMLLVHDRVLFRQAESMQPATVGSDRKLRQCMEDFLLVHSERIGGIILDELWPDRLLATFKKSIPQGVVLYRKTQLPFLGNVAADAEGAARMVVTYALENRFAGLCVLRPFRGYEPSDEMVDALLQAAKGHFPKPKVASMTSQDAYQRMLFAARKAKRRSLVVATEDNAAAVALDNLLSLDFDIPGEIGILSTMGSRIATDRAITSIGFDFRKIGSESVQMLVDGQLRHITIPPVRFIGTTA